MKKTYIITMPNHIGAFLQASKCIGHNKVNITRVSYNKALDEHTLFVDVEGSEKNILKCDEELENNGYLRNEYHRATTYLTEFTLENKPGAVVKVLEQIQKYSFNISYMSYSESELPEQHFKMGLFVDDFVRFNQFVEETLEICPIKVLEYNPSGKVFDNSIFYTSFATSLAQALNSSDEAKHQLLINANLAMGILDETGQSPYQAFDSISKFAGLLANCRNENFLPRITEHQLSEKVRMIMIEPDCGSNTCILIGEKDILFIDCGYSLYEKEMVEIFNQYVDFDHLEKKKILITHPDLDHCGLLHLFDEIYASKESKLCLTLAYEGKDDFREKNGLHAPYVRICKALTNYKPVNPEKIVTPFNSTHSKTEPLQQIGFFEFEDLHFEVYEGLGGHVKGEIVLIDYNHKLAFTGDIYVNLKDMTPTQKKYNQYAPILMTSVDTDSKLCAIERAAIFERLGAGNWKVFGAHGGVKNYNLNETIDIK